MRPPVDVGVHRAPRCEPVVSLVRSRRAPPVPLVVLPKSCSCRWGPCPRPIPRLACLFSFFFSAPERKSGELAGEVTSELQVVGKAASIATQTWVRNNDKTKARAEEREKNIGWIKRLFTAWRVSHAERTERRAERKEAGEDDSEEDEPVEIPLSAVTMHPKREGDPSAGIIRVP